MKKVRKAIILANIVSITLVLIKLITWIVTWSLAVLSSALDSIMDFFVSLFNLYVLKKSNQEETKEYNYGQWKIQWIWAVIEWMIVWFSWLVLIYFAIKKIALWEWIGDIDISIYMMIVSMLLTWGLVFYLYKVSKETRNLTLRADLLHYKTDLFTNAWIIFSLALIKISWFEMIDSIVSIMIWAYILHSSKDIIVEWYHMLMDKKVDDFIIKEVIYIINNTSDEIKDYHMLKTRKSWDDIFIDFHLVFKDRNIKLIDAHTISDKIEITIERKIPNSHVMIHLDPFDDSNRHYCVLEK